MTEIWKFEITTERTQWIQMPEGAQILCAQVQMGRVQIWAKVNPHSLKKACKIGVYGTGFPTPDDGLYVGTIQLEGGQYIFHVFLEQ